MTEIADEDPHGTGPVVEPERRSIGSRLWGLSRELVIVVVLGVMVSTLLRTFVFQIFEIPSESMTNTLLVGDKVAVQKVRPFVRGDVVVFADPGNWLPPQAPTGRTPLQHGLEFIGLLPNSSDQFLIKRVIGMPGDVVICCDTQDRILVNGYPLDETSYLYSQGGAMVKPSNFPFQVTVPAGRIFVLGDHRNASSDSRCHLSDMSVSGEARGTNAFVPIDRVVGVAVLITSPWGRMQSLSRPATFAGVPAPLAPAPQQPSIEPEGIVC